MRKILKASVILSFVLAAAVVAAQGTATQQTQGGRGFQPTVGQAGKDVVWVPTPQALVDKMLDMAKVTPNDFVVDLGSGDGRTVITAAKRGARALGIEYNPDMVALSKQNAAKEGVSDRAQFMQADLFETDLSKATVITMFLLPQINLKLRPKILELKPGTRIVSNSFDMGDWTADERQEVQDGCSSWCTALLWIVPAKVDGAWKLNNAPLTLKQDFQVVSGSLQNAVIADGHLRGTDISFTVGDTQYAGRVTGDRMEGTMKSPKGSGAWSATRAAGRP